MRMIMRTAVAIGLSSALTLGAAQASVAAPTAHPAAATSIADHHDGLGGLLGNLLGGVDNNNDNNGSHHVKVVCDDENANDNGAELLNLDGLNLFAVLGDVKVLGLNLGNCGDGQGDNNDSLLTGLGGGLGGS